MRRYVTCAVMRMHACVLLTARARCVCVAEHGPGGGGRARARQLRGVRQRDWPQGAHRNRRCSHLASTFLLTFRLHRRNTQLHLEIEPGTFLLANSCSIVSTIQARAAAHRAALHLQADLCCVVLLTLQDTAATSSRAFLKLDAGMTEVLRPSLCVLRSLAFCARAASSALTCCALTLPSAPRRYGAQHPLIVVKRNKAAGGKTKKCAPAAPVACNRPCPDCFHSLWSCPSRAPGTSSWATAARAATCCRPRRESRRRLTSASWRHAALLLLHACVLMPRPWNTLYDAVCSLSLRPCVCVACRWRRLATCASWRAGALRSSSESAARCSAL
jgi:hypothetical protein